MELGKQNLSLTAGTALLSQAYQRLQKDTLLNVSANNRFKFRFSKADADTTLRAWIDFVQISFTPNRSLDFGEIARLCHAACFSPSRRRSGLRRGVARNRMRTEAGKMPESLIFLTENSPGVSNDRFGFTRPLEKHRGQALFSALPKPSGKTAALK